VTRAIVLDTGPLGMAAHPRLSGDFRKWWECLLHSNTPIFVPEIADYEVRRNLLLEDLTHSVERLNQLKETLNYLPITANVMLQAAEFWAFARRRGQLPADPKELNGDVILAAQTKQVGAVVATENVGHLSLFVEAKSWRDIAL